MASIEVILMIRWENGSIILTPKRKTWRSFSKVGKADADFMLDRADVVEDGLFEIGIWDRQYFETASTLR